MTKLHDLLLQSGGASPTTKQPSDSFLARFGLRRNPFPASRTILPEVLYDQDAAVTRFAQLFKELLASEPQRRSMAVLAGTGGGKTHFLRYCRWNVETSLEELDRRLLLVEFQAGSGKLQDIAREILVAADLACQKLAEPDFIAALTQRAASMSAFTVHQEDLRAALESLVEASRPAFEPKDRSGFYDFEVLREIFRRWILGGTLTTTEKKYLGVISRIGTGSMAVRVITECLRLARSLDLFEGLVLFLDEIETVFLGSASQYQSFLQDLRYLYDESLKYETGYSLFVLSASTAYGADTLRQVNYPVFSRLGFEPDQRVNLVPIVGIDEARKFADTYIEYERSRSELKKNGRFPDLLSDTEIENAYQSALRPSTTVLGKAVPVNQAPLLDALHLLVEQKRSNVAP